MTFRLLHRDAKFFTSLNVRLGAINWNRRNHIRTTIKQFFSNTHTHTPKKWPWFSVLILNGLNLLGTLINGKRKDKSNRKLWICSLSSGACVCGCDCDFLRSHIYIYVSADCQLIELIHRINSNSDVYRWIEMVHMHTLMMMMMIMMEKKTWSLWHNSDTHMYCSFRYFHTHNITSNIEYICIFIYSSSVRLTCPVHITFWSDNNVSTIKFDWICRRWLSAVRRGSRQIYRILFDTLLWHSVHRAHWMDGWSRHHT